MQNKSFISPEEIWAEVKIMLSSYFESGALSDVLFPRWTEECIKKFRRASHPIKESYLRVENYEACLPEDFKYVKSAWSCGETFHVTIPNFSSLYYDRECIIGESDDNVCLENCDVCSGDSRRVYIKSTRQHLFTYHISHLLTPGTVKTRECCHSASPNLSQHCPDKFDIIDGKMFLNIETAGVHLTYYADFYNLDGIPLIEDNFRMVDYIKKYMMYKCMEYLLNNNTDDTYNQIMQKYQMYKQQAEEAFILADIESKKETIQQQKERTKHTTNRYKKDYYIPGNPNNKRY